MSAVGHLPEASVLTMDGVTWEAYEQVLEDVQERPGLRVTYDRGRMSLIDQMQKHGQMAALAAFRQWIRTTMGGIR